MRETTTAPLLTWSRAFPAVPAQVREARQFLSAILDGHPAEDAILCLSELVANAAIHSRSRERDGRLIVRVQLHGGQLRVEVHDQGGAWVGPANQDGLTGRGLIIVDQLTNAWGRDGDEEAGWITWYEMELQ